MELIVRKYGGSSLDTISKIKNIAEKTKKSINEGKKIVLVVSAMGKSTDELLNKAKMLSNNPNITMEFIEKYPNKPWNYRYLSMNPMNSGFTDILKTIL